MHIACHCKSQLTSEWRRINRRLCLCRFYTVSWWHAELFLCLLICTGRHSRHALGKCRTCSRLNLLGISHEINLPQSMNIMACAGVWQ